MLTSNSIAPLREYSTTQAIDEMVSRAKSLYTLPAVATEVLQLTSDPSVEPQTLKECIARDPALTAKVLRVVNSSLFGLPGEVSDLNQAISLLGMKPLKILVLGFSLPDELFAEVARDQLHWYWTNTLTRAVAAREIGARYFGASGDDAFLAGLLQDLGVLVFAKQLGRTYTTMLSQTIEGGFDLRQAETQAMGFDHIQLTAALLESWHMPRQLVDAIASQHDPHTAVREYRLNDMLARVLHLANLTTALVGEHRLSALPDLLEAAELYCNLDKTELYELIVHLQPKVNHLAEVLSVEVATTRDYGQILGTAHELMSQLTESAFALSDEPVGGPAVNGALFDEALQLRQAMDAFLAQPQAILPAEEAKKVAPAFARAQRVCRHHPPPAAPWSDHFVNQLTVLAGRCRTQWQPLSLVIVAVSNDAPDVVGNDRILSQWLDESCYEELPVSTMIDNSLPHQRIIALPSCDRQEAVRIADRLIRHIERSLDQAATSIFPVHGQASAGVATVTLPSKSFRASDLLQTAARCLAAAQASETSVVKSLEIY